MKQATLFTLSIMSVALITVGCTNSGKTMSSTQFISNAEKTLVEMEKPAVAAQWVQSTYITRDSQLTASTLMAGVTETATRFALQSKNYNGSNPVETRKLNLMLRGLTMPAPADSAKNKQMAALMSELEGMYGSGKYCKTAENCRGLGELEEVLSSSQNPSQLLEAWTGWRTVSPAMKDKYTQTIALANTGAKELGFANGADLWKSKYDMTPADFEKTIDTVWSQVQPLYEQLHCYVRGKLNSKYGESVVPSSGPMPAHVLGNMWAQSWENIAPLVMPASQGSFDLTKLLEQANYNPKKMVTTAENFFVSLGMPQLPKSFYERSMFIKPRDREVVCHASAWPMDDKDDVRIKMCIKINEDNFTTIHHELGHIYYYLAYKDLDYTFKNSANDGFHEAIGDTIELSITPKYLRDIGLLKSSKGQDEIRALLKMALKKIAFLPFGLMVDKWRWQVFDGRLTPETYNKGWWELRKQYQGIMPPLGADRPANAFDPGAKYHIPAFTPYSRYFLAHILQFQFHRALCKTAGQTGPLHECSIFNNKAAGEKLWKMLQMGLSKPWPDALEVATGQREMDATAVREYFAPLEAWLKKQNKGQACGWQ